jgi:branched-chain amino acid transport system ATP-binding protein
MQLEIKNLQVSYGKIKALHGIDFSLDKGEIVCIIGANGAGKSTALRAISRLLPAGDGSVMNFEGKNLLQYQPDKVVSELGISHVPEGRRLFGNLTVMENLKLATFARKDKEQIARDTEQVFSIFPRLKERISQMSGTLSGGEQQMLAVGRAYMSGRKLMLLDEPSMGLAPLLMLSMFEALKEINREGTTILLVEQNARLALKFASRAYVLENGSMVMEGPSEDLLHNPEVKKAYLGG